MGVYMVIWLKVPSGGAYLKKNRQGMPVKGGLPRDSHPKANGAITKTIASMEFVI